MSFDNSTMQMDLCCGVPNNTVGVGVQNNPPDKFSKGFLKGIAQLYGDMLGKNSQFSQECRNFFAVISSGTPCTLNEFQMRIVFSEFRQSIVQIYREFLSAPQPDLYHTLLLRNKDPSARLSNAVRIGTRFGFVFAAACEGRLRYENGILLMQSLIHFTMEDSDWWQLGDTILAHDIPACSVHGNQTGMWMAGAKIVNTIDNYALLPNQVDKEQGTMVFWTYAETTYVQDFTIQHPYQGFTKDEFLGLINLFLTLPSLR